MKDLTESNKIAETTYDPPFTMYHNGVDRATIINKAGRDVTEYFNITNIDGRMEVSFKKAPSFKEWQKLIS